MHVHRRPFRLAIYLCGGVLFTMISTGCSRQFWREQADRDSYELIAEKMTDPDWVVPRMDITPDPRSRFYDPFDPDQEPLPPDDAAAHELLHEVGGWKGYKSWHEFGRAFSVENPHWTENLISGNASEGTILQTSAQGTVSREAGLENLDLGELIELSYIHNRDYQREMEDVYLQALDVSQERFAFQVRYLRTPGASGSTPSLDLGAESIPGGRNSLGMNTALGLSQILPSGAQWALELTNNTLWVFSGGSTSSASSISYSIVQPLLRNAGRMVGLEGLTLSERQLLYAVRDLARFRKEFFGDVTGTSGYLGLLRQHQVIANQRGNIQRLERQVEALTVINSKGREDQGAVFDLSISQLASQLTDAQNTLRQLEAGLQDSYDRYKISLGLPPDLAFTIDTSELKMFELISPETLAMELQVFKFKEQSWGALDLPTPDEVGLREIQPDEEYRRRAQLLRELINEVTRVVVGGIEQDFQSVAEISAQRLSQLPQEEHQRFEQDLKRDQFLFDDAKNTLFERPDSLPEDERITSKNSVEKNLQLIDEVLLSPQLTLEQKARIYELGSEIHQALFKTVQNLQVVQVNLRVETVILQSFDMSLEQVTQTALENRLDLKNSRAILNDARRAVEITANDLKAAINVRFEGDTNTVGGGNNPLDFRGSASSYRAGLEFDTPLDQLQERNAYRAAQINYQRARRDYMAAEDSVKQDVREAWRQLQVLKLNFETSRQSIRLAAIQLDNTIEEAKEASLQVGGGNRNQGLNLLNALNSVLRAQNSFIQTWVQYEQNRINIYRDMGIMKVDDRGVWEDYYYQSLSAPEEFDFEDQAPKIGPSLTQTDLIHASHVEWKTETEVPSPPNRKKAKAMPSLSLPPIIPARTGTETRSEAIPQPANQQSDPNLPRNGLPGLSPKTARSQPAGSEELRNAQTNSTLREIPLHSEQWKLPVVR